MARREVPTWNPPQVSMPVGGIPGAIARSATKQHSSILESVRMGKVGRGDMDRRRAGESGNGEGGVC